MATKRAKAKKKTETGFLEINVPERREATIVVYGTAPLMMNRLHEKATRELLMGGTAKTKGSRATTLKHNPLAEFRASCHIDDDPKGPTLLCAPATWFKNNIRCVAIDIDTDTSKAQIGRLVRVEGLHSPEHVPLWGIPEMDMRWVRQAGPSQTPDVRTRAYIREWVAVFRVSFNAPPLSDKAIINLIGNAGFIQGVGDYRPQKGAGDLGTYRVASHKDPEVKRLMKAAGRKQQVAALKKAKPWNTHTRELLEWFQEEVKARGFRDHDGDLVLPERRLPDNGRLATGRATAKRG